MAVKDLISILPKFCQLSLGAIGALVLSIAPAQALNVGVSPPKFHLDLNSNKNRSQAIKVLNLDSKPVEMKVYVRSWVMNEKNQLQAVPPTEQSLDQWVVFTPSRFKIPPGGSQTIRFAIRPRVQPRNGEHRAVIYIEEVRPAQPDSKTVQVVGRLGVAVYGYVGDIKRVGVLNSVNVDTKTNALNAVFDISSKGNGYVSMKGQYTIWPAAKYPGNDAKTPVNNSVQPAGKVTDNLVDAGVLPTTPVLPDSRRQVILPIKKDLPPGNYVLDIKGDLNGVPITKSISFTVPLNSPVASNNSRNQTTPQRLRDSLRNTQRRR